MSVFDGAIFDAAVFDVGAVAPQEVIFVNDGGYSRDIEARRDTDRRQRRELDAAIDWAFDPTYPEDEAVPEDFIDPRAIALDRIRLAVDRRRDEDDAIAALLMVM